ncbi:MAG: carboxyltransferase domain-containing protein [Gordonia sp. (in: high G+C Gram-positive bacteria)]|uniref:5-oxoprolinase subunit B family protein n=1 Tax=Gordonia sp. (in: high G+C Gram-positive bacteria) TaxID=84139 RepID=UPI003BB6C6BA
MRERSAGDDAVLLDFSDEAQPALSAAGVAHALRVAAADGQLSASDVVATAESVLVQSAPGAGLDLAAVRRAVLSLPPVRGPAAAEEIVEIPVVYDGADLGDVAGLTGTSPGEIVAAHSAISWRVQFMGFAPGFGYLVPDDGPAPARELFAALGRREQSRPAVPPGSVAVAAGYSAVYPRTSPGGWFLLGHTDIALWDAAAEPPALLSSGTLVRFSCAD